MPRKPEIKNVLVIGSGPVVVGQAAEFDYAGSQACLSLREEGIRVVLLNSNPATIQTDRSIADRIYIEPMTADTIEAIIDQENIDAILPTMGGQTALNLAVELDRRGIIKGKKVQFLGTDIRSIKTAEDRRKFHALVKSLGEPIPDSEELDRTNFRDRIANLQFFPVILRTSFSLGGLSGSIISSKVELLRIAESYFSDYGDGTLEVEKSIEGLKELEYEIVRDNAGNCIVICNMENLDPMGVHTGESIVVTPSQTLSDVQYHFLRDSAIKIIGAIGIRGACNIQFALNPETDEYYVVEVNPRTSRSSALASKASGYPIARIATKIAVGYNLTEIKNPITKDTSAAFEPSLDYVTVKIPRWPFDKFAVERRIGVQMKSIGEVMGIGRTFEEAMMKAIASLDTPESSRIRLFLPDDKIRDLLTKSTDLRLYAIFEALFRHYEVEEIAALSKFDPYFINKINNVVRELESLDMGRIPENLKEFKKLGISDSQISEFTKVGETKITRYRIDNGILPSYKAIDTCSGEFEAETPYLYSTYEDEGDFEKTPEVKGKVMVIGSGPNRISQGLEFDYGSVKAVQTLSKKGYTTIMLNSNPETVSTDFDVSDYLYFEPVTLEHVSNVIVREKPKGLIIQFSGQTGQNLASKLSELFGEKIILGTRPSDIDEIENRSIFAERLKSLGIKQPDFVSVANENEVEGKVPLISLPVIVRSSFIIGGRAMDIVYSYEDLKTRVKELFRERPGYPILISRYVEGAQEIDVDFVSDSARTAISGISLHIEEAGTHSGDATMIMGPDIISDGLFRKIKDIVDLFATNFSLVGVSNLQLAVRDDEIFVIELNARSSRSLPFVSKATGTDWVSVAISAMLGDSISEPDASPKSYFVKIPIFPFNRFSDLDIILGPEMKSTGEAMSEASTKTEALIKAAMIMNPRFSLDHPALVSVNDNDKPLVGSICHLLHDAGVKIYATPGTSEFLDDLGVPNETVYRLDDIREPKMSRMIKEDKLSMILNTPTMHSGSIKDGFRIRRMAVQRGMPIITNVRLADAVVRSVASKESLVYREIGEYAMGEQRNEYQKGKRAVS
ncbi:carbamoyl-phosphate synthase large subunit [uncultured archaeon]|nr:carbamoyl-phosphate synthase large subunit [uncultured archaeon]